MDNYEFTASCTIVVNPTSENGKAKMQESFTTLIVPPNADSSAYINPEGVPTAFGVKIMANCYIQGLLGTIRAGHELGYHNEADELRWTIAELERAFVSIHHLQTGHQS